MNTAVKPTGQGTYEEMERLCSVSHCTNHLSVILVDNNIIRLVRIFAPYELELQFAMHREIRHYRPGHPNYERAPCCYSIDYDKRSSELGILSAYPRGANTNPKLNRYRCVHD